MSQSIYNPFFYPHPETLFWHSFSHIIWMYIMYTWHLYSVWRSFWHILWHSIWHSIWQLFWHTFWHKYTLTFFLAFYLASMLTSILAFFLAFFLAYFLTFSLTFFLAFYLTFSLASGWGPAVPTKILRSRLRSINAHLRSGVCGWGSAVPYDLLSLRLRTRRRGEEAGKSVIKSRDPDLARGENNKILGIDYCINIYQHPRNHVNVITTSSQYMYVYIYICNSIYIHNITYIHHDTSWSHTKKVEYHSWNATEICLMMGFGLNLT